MLLQFSIQYFWIESLKTKNSKYLYVYSHRPEYFIEWTTSTHVSYVCIFQIFANFFYVPCHTFHHQFLKFLKHDREHIKLTIFSSVSSKTKQNHESNRVKRTAGNFSDVNQRFRSLSRWKYRLRHYSTDERTFSYTDCLLDRPSVGATLVSITGTRWLVARSASPSS